MPSKKTTQPLQHKRELTGTVVKKSGIKTVSVETLRITAHALYGKRIARTKKYLAHDESDAIRVGEKVTIQETRPLSARKRWVVVGKGEGV